MPQPQSLLVWSNTKLPAPLLEQLRVGLSPHRLIEASATTADNLAGASTDAGLEHADIALGQPDPAQVMRLPKLKWVQLTTAGYTRYDTPEFRAAARRNGTIICNASSVYADPCAQHALAMILALARRLPQSMNNQRELHGWPYLPLRAGSKLLNGQTILLVGYGAIARRLAELLAPFKMQVIGFKRNPEGDELHALTCAITELDDWLAKADHVVNILPASVETDHFFNAGRFAKFNREANYYNLGRGTTHDEAAIETSLRAGQFAAAYIDAFAEEPLPPSHPLWTTPNCFITPHTAGGHANEYERHIEMFLDNLRRFQTAEELIDRIM